MFSGGFWEFAFPVVGYWKCGIWGQMERGRLLLVADEEVSGGYEKMRKKVFYSISEIGKWSVQGGEMSSSPASSLGAGRSSERGINRIEEASCVTLGY